ncbi:MAG TPA: trypsin-like peptidase domain-containing protein, partial [Cellvibrionaceae bacterium]|nr:trypsin-like peptidase domain-containing protein [Cellvibrionaceae bacterium]
LTGLLVAVIALVLFPQLRSPQTVVEPTALAPQNFAAGFSGPVSYAEAVKRAAPAVVNIYTRTKIQERRRRLIEDPLYRHFFNSADLGRQERMQSALGSGVIVSESGYLLTNIHVIRGADEVVVQLQDGRETQATLVGVDEENDLAVLHIKADKLTAIHIGAPRNAQVGDVVLAIGNPFGMGQTVTQGIISATGRHGLGISTLENFIQTDAAINPGNSGGALIDTQGNLLGINTAILDRLGNSSLDGVGLAVPADTALLSLKDIVEMGKVVRGWLGVEAQPVTPLIAQQLNLQALNGVVVTAIFNNGPAHKAGLTPGDIILKVNGQAVGNGTLGMQEILKARPGQAMAIEIWRQGELKTLNAVLGSKPDLKEQEGAALNANKE